jgi:aspartate ammonia-lyase
MSAEKFRIEQDALGQKQVPQAAYYGVQTQRALENFPVSGQVAEPVFVWATVAIKKAAALANMELGKLDKQIGRAIVGAADEVLAGKHREQFVVDVFQAGAGTSHNMNTNEVLANRALELLGEKRGSYVRVHPNDHVNMAQSTNDVFPTAMRIALLKASPELAGVLERLRDTLNKKAGEFKSMLKSGRTHLQDAVPLTMGQEFSAYAKVVETAGERIAQALNRFKMLGLGGTAVGTGLNAHPRYRELVIKHLREVTRLDVQPAANLFYSMQSMADFVSLSGELKNLALELTKICNDLRLLSSGPRTGLAEIKLPPVQPGSSIMPGKVNPVMAEMLNMVCFQVVGHDTTVCMASQAGQLELNVMMPVIIHNLLGSLKILTNGIRVFVERCVSGISADSERCREYMRQSVGLATVFNPYIGYKKAAELAQEAEKSGKNIYELAVEKKILTEEKIKEILEGDRMI